MENGYWVIRTYTGGGVGEKTKFYVPASAARSKRKEAACIKKQEQNEGNVIRKAARYLNTNFDSRDYFVGLDLNAEGMERVIAGADGDDEDSLFASAQHQLGLFFRRLKRRLGEIKYFAVTSDQEIDKRTGDPKPARLHYHMVISGPPEITDMLQILQSAWGLGGVYISHLHKKRDYWALAEYMLEQVRHIPNVKKYTPSRNLVLDKPRDRITHSEAELRLPKGAVFIRRGEHKAGEPQYLRYFLPGGDEDE